MNKKLISAAVMLGVSGAATAVNVNPDGLGQVLLYPYFTGNNGLTTAIHVVNTTGQGKAVKVRFSEAGNSWEILDFNLYLSPYDVWSASFSLDADGNPLVQTRDTSCTVPQFTVTNPANNQARVNVAHNYTHNVVTYGHGDTEIGEAPFYVDEDINGEFIPAETRVTEGHVEIIEMGTVTASADSFDPLTALTHDSSGVPADCGSLVTAWAQGGEWATDRDLYIGEPTGGLFGIGDIIDVSNGIDRGYDAVAIDNFWNVDTTSAAGTFIVAGANTAHVAPGSSFPNLNGTVLTNDDQVRRLGSLNSDVIVPSATGGAALVSDTWTSTIDALSAVLTVSSIYNEFTTYDGTNSATDWVVSFPTKHFYVNSSTQNGDRGQEAGIQGTFFNGIGEFCNEVEIKLYDSEEQTPTGDVNFSPYSPTTDGLCYETNVIEFGNRSVLSSPLAKTVENGYDFGWASLSLYQDGVVQGPTTDLYYHGLPAIGIATFEAQNGTLNGGTTLANYASAFAHKYNRQVNDSSSI